MNNFPKISYSKVDKITLTRSGYLPDTVTDTSLQSKVSPAVDDFRYFFNIECKDIFFKVSNQLKLLDVGCGSGEYYNFFKNFIQINIKYSGCEINDYLVNLCKKTSPSGRFFKSYADNIEANDNQYDIVFSSASLQYTIDRWKESLTEMKRVSNKYVMILRMPVSKYNETCFVEQTVIYKNSNEKYTLIVLNRTELENMFSRLKLKIVKRDYTLEIIDVNGIDEKIFFTQYLLEKK
ncbi:hypothetical protein A2422_02365 [Candidatus Woesebacteria bacterium RIFOXYC1_FULL_31_51]|uniref:Methyltransferase type 11 domain-containing protein n=1 Tax=Candidatus Woesebacteria bacterium GW2011_GWC2_31_9 TaxID=1618586 RepID=A0A0F9YXY2_9BACT|nr:MAG: hypothetical protein UR17_C0001G0932 [Candidatus Woesebacteria bacterium GW2011_GWF1_31_35]KKP23525.1 MAG: hypothetical protein UR11_C0001G0499 [Candidatus Woesebacteria bacterium GW2011_GWC1_30_29]KKP25703.1 MAG: hypothetical protein UR13_C0007G0024 [Candidatus Woesebacteria bacterium GW2011_GWD1_31_12]KKP27801.1 MAG: hypothetical protein UR16_C0002G0131 [Candidatus Woesebacteria bacterium GW2011_GWB1_31_29]KKP31326.1 MAG: hypothetical protein UR21_C0011G0007 [Candidatus Woesebacteria 